ncbi:MAG: hypothetical protein HY741_11280 [Chloroflexi bacterium]|nr:hypothetical protein [Chloroflexota bacterium]
MSDPASTFAIIKENEIENSVAENGQVETREFDFTADLVIELPLGVDPERFFEYLLRVMIAHTEAYDGSMGGSTQWHPYQQSDDE